MARRVGKSARSNDGELSQISLSHEAQFADKEQCVKRGVELRLRLVIISVVGLLGLSGTALAQYQFADGPVELSTTNLAPGDEVEVAGSGFAPGSEVVLTIESVPILLATVTANSGGSFSTTITVPSSVPAGQHTIFATGIDPSGATRVLATRVAVGGSLPFTGLQLDWLAAGAVVLLTLGAAMLAFRGRESES